MATFFVYLCTKYKLPNLFLVAVPLGFFLDAAFVYALVDTFGTRSNFYSSRHCVGRSQTVCYSVYRSSDTNF